MSITNILFLILSIIAIGSALMVITQKNPVHSVLFLIVTFFAISGHYILLNAQFLAIVNIIVYAGAIMVLFLFVVMMMNLNVLLKPHKNKLLQFAGVLSGGALFLVLVAAIAKSNLTSSTMELQTGNYGLVKNLGKVLFSDYVVPFELSSILFLSAMIGAVVISKKD